MLSVSEGKESIMELAPMLREMPEKKKLILEGIMIGINMGTEDKNKDRTDKKSG